MDGQILPQASLFIGIIPALLLLYISLKGYDDYYKDKYIYLSFIAGLIAGLASILLEQATVQIGIIFIVLFPLLEQLFNTILLNIKRLQEHTETTIYGLTLGLGFGSIFIPFSIITANIQTSETTSFILLIIGSMGIILMHGATGVIIGYGISAAKLPKYLLFAILLHIPIPTTILITTIFQIQYLQFTIVFYGALLYYYTTVKIMPRIKTTTERRKRTKKSNATK